MPVLPFVTDNNVVEFAKAFLHGHVVDFQKDIAICLTPRKVPGKKPTHAYFPGLITCIGFVELLSGLYAGKLDGQGLKKLQAYVSKCMDPTIYDADRIDVLYECFRHKVAHLHQPYVVFDTDSSKKKTFQNRPQRLITWKVHASRRNPPIEIVPVTPPKQILKRSTPWPTLYNHLAIISVRSLGPIL